MKKLLLLVAICMHMLSFAQDYQAPKIVPPSPQAQEFIKHTDYAMNFAQGLANTSIPIYTVKSGSISLPLSLSYHADGLNPSAESGTIGLNWNFNFGGMVSRSVKGGRDISPGSIIKSESSLSTGGAIDQQDPDFQYLSDASWGIVDTEYDIFSYILPNQSGKFILPKTGSAADFLKPIILPYKPVKIIPNATLDYFDIFDEKGTLYRYGKSITTGKDETESNKFPSSAYNSKAGKYTWLLTDIISPDKNDTISLSYDEVDVANVEPNYISKKKHAYNHSISDDLFHDTGYSQIKSSSYSSYEYTTKILKKINFKHGRIEFTYKSQVFPEQLLNTIRIFSKTSSLPIQTIKLTQTKYHSDPSRLNWYKLDKVEFFDSQAVPVLVNLYSFSYNTSTLFPVINEALTKETYSIDYWGYYNGATNVDLVPVMTIPSFSNAVLGSANRQANSIYAQTGILKTITYPEGGTATFEYESNTGTGGENLGGLRISKITLQDKDKTIVKSYVYSDPRYIPIEDNFFCSKSMLTARYGYCEGCKMETLTVSSDSKVDLNSSGGPVVYGKVTEYYGTPVKGTNNGWTEHYYNHDNMFLSVNLDLNPFYDQELVNDARTNLKWNEGDRYISEIRYGESFEKETKIFSSTGKCVRDINQYYSNNKINSYGSLYAKQNINSHDLCYNSLNGNYECTGPIRKVGCFDIYTYYNVQLKQQLDSTRTWIYNSSTGDSIETVDKFTYNNWMLINNHEQEKSDGTITKTTTRYPTDIGYLYYNNPSYIDMTDNNMVDYPIERTKWTNGKVVSSNLILYKKISQIFVPDKVYYLQTETPISDFTPYKDNGEKDSRYRSTPEVSFEYDSYGHVLQSTDKSKMVTSYLWSYNQSFPIASLTGGKFSSDPTLSEAAYLGFESQEMTDNNPDNDFWSMIHSGQSFTTDAKVGRYAWYMTTDYGPTRKVKPASPKSVYTFSGWAKTPVTYSGQCYFVLCANDASGQILPNGYATVLIGNTGGLWKYFQVSLNLANVTTAIASVGAYPYKQSGSELTVDELRLQPFEAQLTTYTYSPLVGMTSQTDPNGITTFYEYDSLGRLKNVKDHEGNILKQTLYHYQNQP